MRTTWIVLILCLPAFLLAFLPEEGDTDIIKFKKGGSQRCVIVEETEDAVHFVIRTGTCKVNRSRIETIKHESEDVNAALKEKWKQKNEEVPPEQLEQPEPPPQSAQEKKPSESKRTYTIEPSKLSIAIGGRATGIRSAQRTATIVIEDFGMVKGCRLFRVTVTSYRSGTRRISHGDFYALTSRGMRVDPRALAGYPLLRAGVTFRKTVSGYVAFPTNEELKYMFVKSDIAEFKLNLETGNFETQRGPF